MDLGVFVTELVTRFEAVWYVSLRIVTRKQPVEICCLFQHKLILFFIAVVSSKI
jgi:hypothetical protein